MLERLRELSDQWTVRKGCGVWNCGRRWPFICAALSAFISRWLRLWPRTTPPIQVVETSLSKTTEMAFPPQERADVAIINPLLQPFGRSLFTMMEPVVASSHSLANVSSISPQPTVVAATNCGERFRCLAVVKAIKKLGEKKMSAGWSRASVLRSILDHAFGAVGAGRRRYCRLPKHIADSRGSDKLTVLNVENGSGYQVPLHLDRRKVRRRAPSWNISMNCLNQPGMRTKWYEKLSYELWAMSYERLTSWFPFKKVPFARVVEPFLIRFASPSWPKNDQYADLPWNISSSWRAGNDRWARRRQSKVSRIYFRLHLASNLGGFLRAGL